MVDILINNAGIASGGQLLDATDDRIVATFRVNTPALFLAGERPHSATHAHVEMCVSRKALQGQLAAPHTPGAFTATMPPARVASKRGRPCRPGGNDMSQTDIETMRRIPAEALSQGDLSVIDEVLSPSFVEHPLLPDLPPDREGVKRFISILRQATPDLKYEIVHELSDGEYVVQHVSATGTMQGEFMGMGPTGKKARWSEFHILRLQEGIAVEHWGLVDQYEMYLQLGLDSPGEIRRAA